MPAPLAALTGSTIPQPIDLFTLDIGVLLPAGSTDQSIYRFCNWTETNGEDVTYQGHVYTAIPLEAQGFDVGGGQQLPRPTLTLANVGLAITGLVNTYGDLVGATVTRIRTLTAYLDNGSNPSPDAYFGPDVYVVEQRTREDKLVTTWTLAVPFDLEGMTLPARRMLREQCQWIYRGEGCGYVATGASSGTYTLPIVSGTYTSDGNTLTATAANYYTLGQQISLTISSGGAPSGTYTITQAGAAGFIASYSTQYGRSGTWAVESYGYLNLQKRFRLSISNHGFTAGQTITATLTYTVYVPYYPRGNQERVKFSGTTTVVSANANDFTISATVSSTGASNGSATAYPTYAGSFTGPASTVLVSATNHGILLGTQLSFRFPDTLAANGIYKVVSVSTNTFSIPKPPEISVPGSIEWGGYFDENDNAVYSASADRCGKRLSSCKLRFAQKGTLPFGGFPGLVDRQG